MDSAEKKCYNVIMKALPDRRGSPANLSPVSGNLPGGRAGAALTFAEKKRRVKLAASVDFFFYEIKRGENKVMSYLLGIDIGTSGTKTVLFDESGNPVSGVTSEYPLYQPRAGWAEQRPEDWWEAVKSSVSGAVADSGVAPDEIAGIGLSGQMHGLVMLDKNGEVLRPSIIWCDQRTSAECELMNELAGREKLIEITANPAMTGFTASKLLWVMRNEPEIYEKCAHVLLPKDYIRYKLTGEFAAEVSDGSGMQLMNVSERRWSTELISVLGLDAGMLAPLFESVEVTGCVSGEAAELTGLKAGTPVVGGAGDQAAGGVGNGIVTPGAVSATVGTSGVVFAHTENMTTDPRGRVHTLCHAVPGCWHVMGVTQAAGLSLKWFRDNFCASEKETAGLMGVDPYFLMDREAENSAPGCGGLFYLPYLMGERTPHLDPDARGAFIGLTARHTKNDMLRAVMEGVGYSMKDCLEIIRGMGVPVKEIRVSGGGGKSGLWRQMMADMFGRPVVTTESSEGPALGAAILAGAGTGVYSSVQEGCKVCVRPKTVQKCVRENAAVYKKAYPVYKKLYRSLKGDFGAIAKL